MRTGTPRRLVIGLVAGMLFATTAARAQEEKCLRPELEQLLQTVAEKFQEAADSASTTTSGPRFARSTPNTSRSTRPFVRSVGSCSRRS